MNRMSIAQVLFCISVVTTPVAAHAWALYDEEDGVKSYRKEVKGSPVVAFMGKTTIDAPLEMVLGVLGDNTRRTEWVDRLETSTVLETVTPYEHFIYQAYDLPWPISDRDYVYHAKATNQGDSVVLHIKSITHRKAPKTVGVRAHLHSCTYTLVPTGEGQTHVTVEVHTDPKGHIPNWLVNLIQKKWPIKTLSGIRRQVKKPAVKPKPRPPITP
ncbi:MAG: START domain-containing protein [Myxococcota bacterium]|nr:START domain-containing protein [Myxococcota bacterium]